MNGPWGYDLRPQEIENKSFEIIDGLADLSRLVTPRGYHSAGRKPPA